MIAKLRHRVLLCTQKDVAVGADLSLKREGVLGAWAAVEPKKASTFSAKGAAYGDNQSVRTHVVTIRHRTDINVSNLAWLYEERLKSSPRWFKVLAVNETEGAGRQYFKLDCRLVERGDELAEPTVASDTGPAKGLPEGVKL